MSDSRSNENDPHTRQAGTKPSWLMIGIVGALVVVLSFFASFWGASVASAPEEPDSAIVDETPEPTAEPEVPEAELPEAEVPAVLPAGADVRVGAGLPDAGHGSDGDVYINIDTADTFVRTDGAWLRVGNIRDSALENLAGEQGTTGEQGAAGEAGEAGAPGSDGVAGADGTQVVLGVGTPDPAKNCGSTGDVFIDTVSLSFYKCTAGAWAPFAQ